jgi:hypothetical protein
LIEMKRLGFALVLGARLFFPAAAFATGFPDCDKFDAPLAYNRCLAAHGPSASRVMGARAVSEASPVDPAVRTVHRAAGGRMSATFTVEDSGSDRHRRRRER